MGERVTFADLLKKAEEKKKSVDKPKLEIVPDSEKKNTEPTPPTPLTNPTHYSHPTPPTSQQNSNSLPTAPERDFARVANSIVRDVLPQGLFIGKSKQIYDFLYLRTRGSIQPRRSIRVTKSNLMRGSDIGSERTLLKNLNHLKSIGLLKVTEFDGQHEGNEYEVYLPEEIHPTPPIPRHLPHPPQKVGTLPPVETTVGGVGQIQENKELTKTLRHNTKTINIDDERTLEIFTEKFSKASEKLTGRKLNAQEAEKWGNLADLLILELEVAARRADSVSSIPAFLTEVLRRQFFALRQQPSSKSTKTKPDKVGKADSESYEIKSLDEKGRKAALIQLREFAGDDFLEDFKKWYTPEDWIWLMKELKKNSD